MLEIALINNLSIIKSHCPSIEQETMAMNIYNADFIF